MRALGVVWRGLRRLRNWFKDSVNSGYPAPMDGGLPYLPAQIRELDGPRDPEVASDDSAPPGSETRSPARP